MVNLDLPFNKFLPRWLGYSGNANGLGLWWRRDLFCIHDGGSEHSSSYNPNWRQIECSEPFQKTLSKVNYRHDVGITGKFDEDMNGLFIDLVQGAFYSASVNKIVMVLQQFNKIENDQSLKNAGFYNVTKNSIKTHLNWGVGGEKAREVFNQLSGNNYQQPSTDSFRQVNQWLKSI